MWFLAALAAICLSFSGTSPSVAKDIQIVVGSELDYPPYALVSEDGEADGFSVDLMKAVCEAMGIDVRFRVGPWDEVRAALERGEIDALPLVSYSKEREEVFDFTTPHTVAHGAIFKRNDAAGIGSVVDLRDKAIIVMRADAGHDWLIRNDISDNLTLTKTVEESLRLLASGKHDYALAPRLVGLLVAKESGLSNIETTGPEIDAYGRGYGFAVKEGNLDLLAHLNEGLAIIKTTGRYDQIYDKWLGIVDPRGVPGETIVRYVLIALSVITVMGGLVLVWIVVLRRTVRGQTAELQTAHDDLESRVEERTRELLGEIAERKRTEDALRESEERFRIALAALPITVYNTDRDLRFTWIHNAPSGKTLEFPLGKRQDELPYMTGIEDLVKFQEEVLSSGIGGRTVVQEHVNGKLRYNDLAVEPLKDAKGKIVGLTAASVDMTERVAADKKLRDSEEKLLRAESVAHLGHWRFSLDDEALDLSPEVCRIFGYDPENYRPKVEESIKCFHPDDQDEVRRLFGEAIETGQGFEFERRIVRSDGAVRNVFAIGECEIGDGGETTGLFGIVQDITERKQAEEASRESEERFSKAFGASPTAMVIVSIEGDHVIDVNDRWLSLLGSSREEVIGKTAAEIGIWADIGRRSELVERLERDGSVRDFEASFFTKSGEERLVLLAGEKIEIGGNRHLLVVLDDVTEGIDTLSFWPGRSDVATVAE